MSRRRPPGDTIPIARLAEEGSAGGHGVPSIPVAPDDDRRPRSVALRWRRFLLRNQAQPLKALLLLLAVLVFLSVRMVPAGWQRHQ